MKFCCIRCYTESYHYIFNNMNTSGDLRNLILGKKCMESVFPSYMQIDSNLLQNSVMVEPTRTAGKLSLWKMVNFNKGPRGIRENVLVFMQNIHYSTASREIQRILSDFTCRRTQSHRVPSSTTSLGPQRQ